MLLGIALAVSTASGSFDVNAPGFWDRQYRIPNSTCHKTVFYVTPSAEDAADDLEKCRILRRTPYGPWEANCYLPPEDADSLVRFLKAERHILKYQERCAPADALPELDFKQSHLKREYAALGVSSTAFPSLAGFMDYQFQTLEQLIRARDRSTMTALTVLAVPQGSSGPQDAHVRNLFPRYDRQRGAHRHPWFPSRVPACGQVGYFALLFDEDAGPPGRKDVRAAALRLGPPYKEEACRSAAGSLATVIAKAPFKAEKSLGSLPGLRYALPVAKTLPAGVLPDDEKFDGLSRDAQALGPRLTAGSTVKALIDAELERLAPQAEALKALRQGVLVKVDSGRRVPTTGAPAPAAAAAEPETRDYEDPAFWRKIYRIPDAYCSKKIHVETAAFKTVAQAVSKCAPPPTPDSGRWDAECRLSLRDADTLVDTLKKNGRILAYHQNCNDADPMTELDYKSDRLKEEAEQVGLAAAPWPGIRGLMEATLGNISWLIENRDRAALVRVNVSVFLTERAHETEPSPRNSPTPVNEFERHPWWRISVPVCKQVDYISAVFDAPPGSAREQALLGAARRLGTDFTEPNCRLLTALRPRTAVFSRLPLADIRGAIFSLKGLRSWRKVPRSQSAQALPDDLKLQALEEDLRSAGQALEAAPHIRGLVRSEVERLRPQAERLAELRGGTLVLFQTDVR